MDIKGLKQDTSHTLHFHFSPYLVVFIVLIAISFMIILLYKERTIEGKK